MSDLELKQIHKFFRATISSIKYTKKTNSDITSLDGYNKNLPKNNITSRTSRLLRNKCNNLSHIRVNNFSKLLDIYLSLILDEELPINKIVNDNKQNTDFFYKIFSF